MVDQPHEAEDGHETNVLEGANGRVKTHLQERIQSSHAGNVWHEV